MKKLKSIIFLLFVSLSLSAQTEMEYKMEIGGMLGTSFYLGDTNYTGFYKNSRFAGALMARYNINPRMALKFNIGTGGIAGDASGMAIPEGGIAPENMKFNKMLYDIGCQYEIHFWAYGTGNSYKNTKRIVPYLQVGIGATAGQGVFTANFPFGVGVKYKVAKRLNIGLDWTIRISLSDSLDGIGDPYKIKSGFLKNADSYGWTMVYLSYDIMPKLRKCNN